VARKLSPALRSLGFALIALVPPGAAARAQAPRPPRADLARIAEARRLAGQLADSLWPGWGRTAFPILLVGDSAEFLIGHPRPTSDFVALGYDAVLRSEIRTRPRGFPPTFLATFPAVGGMPTIVIGSAERTGKSPAGWVLTLLHEHFHQWQFSRPDYYAGVAALDLAGGDTTGQWMLDYAFPYQSAAVQRAMRGLAVALSRALDVPAATRGAALTGVRQARDTLRGLLEPADYRYFEFQLWQEGVARYIEYAAAAAAGGELDAGAAGRRPGDLRRELAQIDLERQERTAFYPLGAALALLLDATAPGWKEAYGRRPFALAALLPDRVHSRR
jgi:hypothetical protein